MRNLVQRGIFGKNPPPDCGLNLYTAIFKKMSVTVANMSSGMTWTAMSAGTWNRSSIIFLWPEGRHSRFFVCGGRPLDFAFSE